MAGIINMSYMAYMSYMSYIAFGLLPSFIWLLFYLRKDSHPEPNLMVLKVFFFGALAGGIAALVEIGLFKAFGFLLLGKTATLILNIWIAVAFTEEALKYLASRLTAFKHREFDEPLDAVLYMIIAALGFAALENILILFSGEKLYAMETFAFSGFRFVSATFLHALCSGMLGCFIAASFFKNKRYGSLTILGLLIAVLLHGAYNFSIMSMKGNARFIIPIVILIMLASFLSWGFKKLKRLKSICVIK